MVHVAKATILQPMSEAPVLIRLSAGVMLKVNSYISFEQCYICMAARGTLPVLPGGQFHVMLARVSRSFIN